MVRALSHGQGWRVVRRRRPLKAPWFLIVWPVLIVASWGLIALPLLVWGWKGLWAYALLAGLCALTFHRDRSRRKA
ncbi:MAG TPA: hypothetical protein VKT32_14290 [Chthonomonadaceae bacterium]|nr:hypothetical protein [Chthonomonadaceae bacterium]